MLNICHLNLNFSAIHLVGMFAGNVLETSDTFTLFHILIQYFPSCPKRQTWYFSHVYARGPLLCIGRACLCLGVRERVVAIARGKKC